MHEPELEISQAGVKIRRLGPLGAIVVLALICETAVTIAAMWIDSARALWLGRPSVL